MSDAYFSVSIRYSKRKEHRALTPYEQKLLRERNKALLRTRFKTKSEGLAALEQCADGHWYDLSETIPLTELNEFFR